MNRFFLIFPLLFSGWLTAQTASPHQLLWKITGNGLEQPSWLYGTIHVRDPRAFRLTDSTISALSQSEVFAMELHPDSVIQEVMGEVMKGEEQTENIPQELDFHEFLTASEYQELEHKILAETGMTLDQVDPAQPGLFQYLLSPEPPKRTGKPTFLDAWLFRNAKLMGKEVVGMERLEEQNAYIPKAGPAETWKSFLTETNPEAQQASFDRLLDQYAAGDLKSIEKWAEGQWSSEDKTRMEERNRTMLSRIKGRTGSQSCFIAVGIAHLPGKTGLIQLFRDQGYTVEAVSATFAKENENWEAPYRELPWIAQEKPDMGYRLEWPVAPVLFVKEPIVEMYFVPDVASGNTYYAGWIRLPMIPDIENDTTFLATMTRFLIREGETNEVVYRKTIESKGAKGRELGLRNESGQFYRSRFFLRDNLVYLFLVGPGEATSQSQESNRFLASVQLFEPKLQEWEIFSSAEKGYEVVLPPGTQALTQQIYSPEEGWTLNFGILSGGSVSTRANYTFRHHIFPPDLRPESDEIFFESNLELLIERMEATLISQKMGKDNGTPFMEFTLADGTSENQLHGRYYLRGARSYMALVSTPDPVISMQETNRFFQSIRFFEGTGMKGLNYELTDFDVSIWFPTLPQVDTEAYEYADPDEPWAQQGTFFAQDTLNGTTWFYNRESYSRFAALSDTSEFIRQWTAALIEEGDRLVSQEVITENGVLTVDVQIEQSESHEVFRRKFYLRGHAIHSLSAWLPREEVAGKQAQAFFSSLEFLTPGSDWDLFTPKKDNLFNALVSQDPFLRKEAIEVLPATRFQTEDLPQFHALLADALPDDHDEEWGSREAILEKLTQIDSPSSVPVLEGQLKNREKWGLEPEVVLSAIAGMENPLSVQTLGKILQESPPELAYDADGYALMLGIIDSLSLYKEWGSWLPKLSQQESYEMGTYLLLNMGLTQKIFTKSGWEQHIPLLIARGQQLTEWERNGLMLETSGWETAEMLTALLGVLKHSAYDPEVGTFLQSLKTGKDPMVRLRALEILIAHGYPPDQDWVTGLGANVKTRMPLWKLLKQWGKEGLFPAKWKKQKYFAESLILEDIELFAEEPVTAIQLLDDRPLELHNTRGRGFLFKYQFGEGEEWHVAFSGLQPVNKKEVLSRTPFNMILSGTLQDFKKDEFFEVVEREWNR